MSQRVPIDKAAAAHRAELRKIRRVLGQHHMRESLDFCYTEAVELSPVDTGKARFGITPTMGRPVALHHADQDSFPKPGRERLPRRREILPGQHGFVTYHAEDSRGVFDYAGIMLEDGYSPQAPQGVLGPTVKKFERNRRQISNRATRKAKRDLR